MHYSGPVLEAICEQALTSTLNGDGSMRENFVVRPEFYQDVLYLIRTYPGLTYECRGLYAAERTQGNERQGERR